MKAYVIVDDLVKELNQTYKGEMTDICLMPLGVENWLRERAAYPVQLHLHSKEKPDPELDEVIDKMKRLCAYYEDSGVDYSDTMTVLRYLEQLRLLKGEYARVFFEEKEEKYR